MATKIFTLGVALIMCLVFFSGCGEKTDYYTDRVLVLVGSECREQFLAGDLSTERFEWQNVKKIEDSKFVDSSEHLMLTVYLKKKGKQHVEAAIKHFKTLNFVLEAIMELKEKQSIY